MSTIEVLMLVTKWSSRSEDRMELRAVADRGQRSSGMTTTTTNCINNIYSKFAGLHFTACALCSYVIVCLLLKKNLLRNLEKCCRALRMHEKEW